MEKFMQENNLDDSYYGNWARIVKSFRDKREIAEQKDRLVEEVKGMAKPQTSNNKNNRNATMDLKLSYQRVFHNKVGSRRVCCTLQVEEVHTSTMKKTHFSFRRTQM